jgi:hypothetical protein
LSLPRTKPAPVRGHSCVRRNPVHYYNNTTKSVF